MITKTNLSAGSGEAQNDNERGAYRKAAARAGIRSRRAQVSCPGSSVPPAVGRHSPGIWKPTSSLKRSVARLFHPSRYRHALVLSEAESSP
jgi:hypothetical protein